MATVREIREQRGLSPSELARRAGVSYQTVRRLERGEPVSRVFVMRILNALQVTEQDVEGIAVRD